jgi:hypothetical protein
VSKFGYASATNRLRNNRYPTIYEWAAGWSQYSSGAFTVAATASGGSATTFLANNLIETSGTYRLGPADNYGNALVLSNGNFLVYASNTFSTGQPLVGVRQLILASPTGGITFNTSGSPGSLTNNGTTTLSSTVTLSGLTVSTALALDASKNIVSVTNTGSGNNVLATSPTLVTPVLGTPSSGTLSNCTVDGTNLVGYRNAPQTSAGASAYTLVLGDAGDHVIFTGGTTATLTVPTNASVAFPIGTTILVVNDNSGNLTISGAGVTFQLAAGATGNRTVATKGLATCLKTGTDTWYVSGAGVT